MQTHLAWFVPSPWALWGSAQSVFAQWNPAARYPYTRREAVRMEDGVQIHLDWKETDDMVDNTPILFVLHGIAGSGESKVSRNTTDLALDRGWRSVVYVRRGHGDSSLLPVEDEVTAEAVNVNVEERPLHPSAPAPSPRNPSKASLLDCKGFPMHCDIADMARVVEHVQKEFPNAPKMAAGFSAGANLIVKYLGTRSTDNPFIAAVSVSNGHALVPVTMAFLKRPVSNVLMASALQGLLDSRLDDVKRICDARGITLDFKELQSTNNVRRFEEILMLPLYPEFADIDAYYEFNSCYTAFEGVSVPLLTVASHDDPLIRPNLADYASNASKSNPNVISVTTSTGGHLGWLSGWRGRWWQQDVVFSFLDSVLAERTPAL